MLSAVLGALLAAEGTRPSLVAVTADGIWRTAAVMTDKARQARALRHRPECCDPGLSALGHSMCRRQRSVTGGEVC